MRFSRYVAISATVVAVGLLVGCGGGGGGSNSSGVVPPASGASAAAPAGGSSGTNPAQSSAVVLSAGSSVTMAANSSVSVPAGTTVRTPDGNTVTVNGSSNTVHTSIGAIIDVPGTATGTATNLVTTVTATDTAGMASNPTLKVTVLAGSDTHHLNPVDGKGTGAVLSGVIHMAVDPGTNNLLITDNGDIKSVTQAGIVTTLPNMPGSTPNSAGHYEGIAIDAANNIFASGRSNLDSSSMRDSTVGTSIWKRNSDGVVLGFALNWETGDIPSSLGFGGLVIDNIGNLFYADSVNYRIVKFTPSGVMSVFAGNGQNGSADGVGIAASFEGPQKIAIDANGNLFVADSKWGGLTTVRKITPKGVVSTLALNLNLNLNADAIAVDPKGNVFLARGFKIQRFDSNGNVTTYPIDTGYNFIYLNP